MPLYQDGSYASDAGRTLIAKVLAGRGKMRYTRAAVGKGHIPDDRTPRNMTEPPDYVMDARICSITNPIGGECQVSVQVNSADVEQGFFATAIILYAEDPDLGEVPYTYLVMEEAPEYIRPKTSVIGKIAKFDLIAAVDDIERVSAIVDPNALLSYRDAEALINSKNVASPNGIHGLRYHDGKLQVKLPHGWATLAETKYGLTSEYIDGLMLTSTEIDALKYRAKDVKYLIEVAHGVPSTYIDSLRKSTTEIDALKYTARQFNNLFEMEESMYGN